MSQFFNPGLLIYTPGTPGPPFDAQSEGTVHITDLGLRWAFASAPAPLHPTEWEGPVPWLLKAGKGEITALLDLVESIKSKGTIPSSWTRP